MSIITDEMVEAALQPMIDVVDGYVWEEDRDRARDAMRAALAAVAPLIAQAERERCLAVARRWTRDGQSATAHGIILGIEELDAIRARSTEAGQ